VDAFFKARSVALIGASDRPRSVGAVTLRNLRGGGFAGDLFLVNPRHDAIDGLRVYHDIASLPVAPELAVLAIPPDQVVKAVNELGMRGTKAAVILTAGFGELGERGAELQREMLAAARPHELRIIGPNCVGVIAPGIGLNAGFAQVTPPRGDIAFLSQSGAMVTSVLDWAQPRCIGFSCVVSLGDMADVDFGDMLAYLAADPATRAIALYVEGITDAGKFMAAARAAARSKPLLVLKVGRQAEGAKAAHSHTGALAGSDVVYDAAFRRAGMLRVGTMPEIFDGIETLALTSPLDGDRLAILTNGGGPGVIATDALVAAGGKLAELAPATIAALDAMLPPTWSHGNPVDMIGDAPAEHYAGAVDALLGDEGTDAVLVLNCPTALADPAEAARAVIDTVTRTNGRHGTKDVYTTWLGEYLAAPSRQLFSAARLATYETPEDAVQGFMHRVHYHRNQLLLAEGPAQAPDTGCDAATVQAIVTRALAGGRQWLDPHDVASVLRAYGIPSLQSRSVADPDGAARAAAELGGAVALKIDSPDITHKSDVGGVALNLEGSERVRREAAAMFERVKNAQPEARIDGFLVQEMAPPSGALELIVGMSVDRVFGPVVLFGHGGTAVELIADTTVELPPLNLTVARAQMARTRVWRLLQGYRNSPPADLDAIAGVLIRVGALAADHPNISELDINPLLADARGVLAVDARIAVTSTARAAMALAPRAQQTGVTT
jgi:acetyltransferase